MPSRNALLIGINYPGTSAALSGCVADAMAWADYFARRGYSVRVVADEHATRENILRLLEDLVEHSASGDRLVFGYSGHGTQVRDLDRDELDGIDEAICPVDFQTGAFITDDDLRAVLSQLPAGVGFTALMDCCFSGTITRLLARVPTEVSTERYARYLPRTTDLDWAHLEFRNQQRTTNTPAGFSSRPEAVAARSIRDTYVTEQSLHWVTIGACQPWEVAYESDGQGDFTRHALSVLNSAKRLGSNLSLNGFMRRLYESMGPEAERWQTPMLDAHPDEGRRVLFGSRAQFI